MTRTIRILRAEGQLAAVVDLTQIGARGESEEPGRWYYSIAYRIVRELRLKVELQRWWQEKSSLMGDERLAEFFWEIVLTNTTVPVTIFIDEIERAVDLPFSKDLFTAIRSCYNSRTTEPDFGRLNFVVLGVASPQRLAPDRTISPFDLGTAIELDDFSVEETYRLAPGFPASKDHAELLLDKIYHWAGGQPYLTQKIARGVVRRGARAEDVDLVVRERFLAQGARREEPLLNHIRTLLTRRAPGNRQALVLLGKIGKGARIPEDQGSVGQQVLRLAGLTATDGDGMLTFRNRLFSTVFSPRWVSSSLPFNWRAALVAAAAAGVMVLVPWWYTQVLPQPYIQSMSIVSQPLDDAYFTYQRLHRLPGFGATADRLFTDILAYHSELAETFAEVDTVDGFLRDMPDRVELAERLMGSYWLRRAAAAARAERRDEALLLASAAIPGQGELARTLATELIGTDYESLQRSFRLSEAPAYWEADWESQEIVLIAPNNGVRRLSLNDANSTEFADSLTALQHLPVRRELSVDEPGSAGAFVLELDVAHLADEQILVSLEAPDGERASFALPANAQDSFEFRAVGRSPLAALADANRQGVWRLTLVDREEGYVGELSRWGILFAEELRGWNDDPEPDLIIPDPGRTDQIDITVSADGQLAIARPSRPGAVGTLALWNISAAAEADDLELETTPEFLALAGNTSRLLAVAGNTLTLWNTAEGSPVARVATQTGFLLPPTVGSDGDYIAIAEQLDLQESLYSLLRTQDGELVASVTGVAGVRDWMLGPQARYLALLGPTRNVQLMDPRRGDILAELPHERDPVRLIPAAAGDLLISVDDGGDIFVWDLSEMETEAPVRRRLGMTVDPLSVSVAVDGSVLAFEAPQGHVVARDLAGQGEPLNLRAHSVDGGIRTRLSPDGSQLITSGGALLQLWQIDERRPGTGTDLNLSALALDKEGRVAALGFRDGHVQVLTTSQLETGPLNQDGVDYIGHQGSVSSIAVDTSQGSIVSGGDDGVVRIWDVATGAPLQQFMRHEEGRVNAVALSSDGRWILSAAESSARLWNAEDGMQAAEVPVNGAALSVAFAPRADRFVVGDSVGNLFFATLTDSPPVQSSRAQDAVLTMAYSPDGSILATGDLSGRLQLWDPVTAEVLGEPWSFPHPVRWVGFSEEAGYLVAQTDHWLHRLLITEQTLSVSDSRMLEVGMEAGAALATPHGDQLRLVGGRGLGRPVYYELDLSAPAVEPLPAGAALLERDWPGLLGLELDPTGEVVPR
jgi:WD40 repeat protein/subtilisin-like proprotein convertase family protein